MLAHTRDTNDFSYETTLLRSILFTAFRISGAGLLQCRRCEEYAAFLCAKFDVLPVSMNCFCVL
jgi:hypothetical protein